MSQDTEKSRTLPKLDDASEKLLNDAIRLYTEFVQARMRAGNLPGEPDRSLRGQAFERAMKVLQKYPDNPGPLFVVGMIYHGMGEFPQAESYLKKAVEAGASSLDLHRMLAETFLERGAFDEAEKHLDIIKQHDQTRPEIYELKAELALRKEDWESRLDSLSKLLEITPSDERAATAIATTWIKKGRDDIALEKLLALNEQIPNSPEISFILGNIYADIGKCNEAKKYYLKTLELNPDHNMARFELANVLDELDKPQEALELYREYLGVINTDPDAYYNAAGVAERLENRTLAIQYYLEFLKLTDDDNDFKDVLSWLNQNAPGNIEPPVFLIELALAHLAHDDPEAALKELKIADEINIEDRRIDFLKGKAYFALGDYRTALSSFKKALEREDPGDMEGFSDDDILLACGDTSLELGDFDDAVETANELIAGGMQEEGYTLKGDALLERDRFDEAKDEFIKALKINLFSFDGIFGLGESFDGKKDYQNAATCFRLCLEIESDDEDALYRLGMDCLRLGYKEWAMYYLKKYIAISHDGEYRKEVLEILQ